MKLVYKKKILTEDQLFEMANKSKAKTGLSINIYLSIKPANKKEELIRVKVQNNYADRFDVGDLLSIVIYPNKNFEYFIEHTQKVKITNKDIEEVLKFVKLNYAVIKEYWDGLLDSEDMSSRLKKVNI